MTKLVQEAIEVLKEMPEDRQETAARAIINYGTDDDELQLTASRRFLTHSSVRR